MYAKWIHNVDLKRQTFLRAAQRGRPVSLTEQAEYIFHVTPKIYAGKSLLARRKFEDPLGGWCSCVLLAGFYLRCCQKTSLLLKMSSI